MSHGRTVFGGSDAHKVSNGARTATARNPDLTATTVMLVRRAWVGSSGRRFNQLGE